jgi:hypothetical protein
MTFSEKLKIIDKFRWLLLIISIVISFLLFIVFSTEPLSIKFATILPISLIAIIGQYMIYFILWIQLINPFCPKKILIAFTWFFGGSSIFALLLFFICIIFQYDLLEVILNIPSCVALFIGAVHFRVKNAEKIDSK